VQQHRYLRSTNRSLLCVELPALSRKGKPRSTFFKPGETKKLHVADVQSKFVARLIKKHILVDVTTMQVRAQRKVDAKKAAVRAAQAKPVAQSQQKAED